MDILEKADYYQSAMAELSQFPELKTRIAMGDVTITQHIGAISQMLAMLNAQMGIASVENWIKARDNLVLADASARGILPFGKSASYEAVIYNGSPISLIVSSGRRLLDNQNRIWIVKDGAEIQSGQTVIVKIEQYEFSEVKHSVSATQSFYKIPITPPDNHQFIKGIEVWHSDGTMFQHIEQFNNIKLNERVYHVLADELMNVSIQFGLENKIGYIPQVGEKLTIKTFYTSGNVQLKAGTNLYFEYQNHAQEHLLRITSGNQIQSGANPPNIDELREMTNFPMLYNSNAVFLGEFKFLILRSLAPFVFLNVWNERAEEKARGASVDNINTLFISFIKDGIDEDEAKEQIKRLILKADNSYKIQFVPVLEKTIPVNIQVFLAPQHDDAAVRTQIIVFMLNQYGKNSIWARMGNQRINWQNTVKNLRENIVQLQDGVSDISVSVIEDMNQNLPESFRFVAENSLNIAINKLQV